MRCSPYEDTLPALRLTVHRLVCCFVFFFSTNNVETKADLNRWRQLHRRTRSVTWSLEQLPGFSIAAVFLFLQSQNWRPSILCTRTHAHNANPEGKGKKTLAYLVSSLVLESKWNIDLQRSSQCISYFVSWATQWFFSPISPLLALKP